MTIVDGLVRGSAIVASVLLFYLAWCVYPDEEKRWQSRIEDWWLQFDDLRRGMVARHAAFTSVISARVKDALDRVFRGALFSVDAIAVAACLSIASLLLFLCWVALRHRTSWGTEAMMWTSLAFGLLFLFSSISPAFWHSFRRLPMMVLGLVLVYETFATILWIIAWVAGWLSDIAQYMPDVFHKGPLEVQKFTVNFGFLLPFIGLCSLAVTTCFTLLFVSLFRSSLTKVVDSGKEWPVLSRLFIMLVPAGLFFAWGEIADFSSSETSHFTVIRLLLLFMASFTLGASAIAVFSLFLLVMVAGLMFVHRAVWPLMSRLLYVLPRHHVLENKKTLNSTAVVLLGVALHGDYGWRQLAKFIGL